MSQVISFSGITPAARFDDIAWSEARVEEAATADGEWATIDTIALDPVDPDPSVPQSRSFTTGEASDEPNLWYRVVFADDDGNTSQPTVAVQNAEPVAPFATALEFAVRLGQTLTDEELTRATALLSVASGLIQQAAGQTIVLIEDDVLLRRGTTDERILLPQRPVVDVASVELNGVTLSESSWYLDGATLVRKPVSWLSEDLCRGFGREWQTLTITYTHGYEEIPELLHAITMEAVARVWVNPGSVIQENIGPEGTTYAPYSAPPRGLLLTDAEEKAIRRMFGRKAISVTIGG